MTGRSGLITRFLLLLLFLSLPAPGILFGDIYINSAVYQDWTGFKSTDLEFYNRLSTRLKLDLLNRKGKGWTLSLDIRNRATLGSGGTSQFIIYNSNISYERTDRRVFFTMGQMNLYNSAGAGQLTGILAGFRLIPAMKIGVYGGLNPDIYHSKWDLKYRKYGIFTTYRGSGARQATLSYNFLQYDGISEREYLYANTLLPVSRKFIFYGSMEYELQKDLPGKNRLARLFANARIDPLKGISVNLNYSSGKGIDYHQFILDHSMDPSLKVSNIERFYYTETYGARLTLSPIKKTRFHISRRYSELKDRNIQNHSTRFGLSLSDFPGSGFGVYGNYTFNRGDLSESDTYLVRVTGSRGKISWSAAFSSYFNSIRITGEPLPEIVHYPDRDTFTGDVFYFLNKRIALAAEYSFSYSKDITDHQFFLRFMYRFKRHGGKK